MTWVLERHKRYHFNAKDNLQNIICFKPYRELSSQGHHDNWIPNGDKSLQRWMRFVISLLWADMEKENKRWPSYERVKWNQLKL